MDAIYNWTGSLQTDPQHFALFIMTGIQMKTLAYPSESITPQTILYMEEMDDAIPFQPSFQHPLNDSLHTDEERVNQTLLFDSEIDYINWQAQSLPDNHRPIALVNSHEDSNRENVEAINHGNWPLSNI